MGIERIVQKLTAPLRHRVRLMIGRAIVALVNDDLKEQAVQISLLNGEVRDGVERYQEYGFTSHPHEGAEAITLFIGGNRDHGIVIATGDRRYRLKGLQAGEVALYTDEGDSVILKRNQIIEVNTATFLVKAATKARIESPQLECTGEIIDRVDTDGRTMDSMRAIYDGHTHPGDSGGTTGSPNQQME